MVVYKGEGSDRSDEEIRIARARDERNKLKQSLMTNLVLQAETYFTLASITVQEVAEYTREDPLISIAWVVKGAKNPWTRRGSPTQIERRINLFSFGENNHPGTLTSSKSIH